MTENKLRLKRLMFSIASLVNLGQKATSSKDLAQEMKAALYVVTGIFSVPKAALFTYNQHRKRLELLTQKGLAEGTASGLNPGIAPAEIKKFRVNEPCSVRDLSGIRFFERNRAFFSNLDRRIFIPLFAKDEFVGSLVLGRKLSGAAFRASDKEILRVVAHQLAMMLHNARLFVEVNKKAAENKKLYDSMKRIYHDTIQAFSAAIDAKDEYTRDHSYRVACYAVAIARELGWKKRDVEGIYVAGLLHDIGKIIIDTKVIKKGEELTAREIQEIKKHPQVSYNILSKIRFPWKNIERFVRHHHERVDGKGYPDSLAEQELNDGEKILALADAFDAMTTDRPYREKLALPDAFDEVMKCRGTQFDEKITNTFFDLLQREMRGETKELQIIPHLQKSNTSGFIGPALKSGTRRDERTNEKGGNFSPPS